MKHIDPLLLLSEAQSRAAYTRQRLAFVPLSLSMATECMVRSNEALAISRELLRQPLYDVFTGRPVYKRQAGSGT